MTVRYALGFVVAAGVVAFYFDKVVGKGLLIGGLAGVLAFWIMAYRVEKLATQPLDRVQSELFKGMLIRMVIYALSLGRAFYLDTESMHGLIAAALGLFITHLVMIVLGITGLDLRNNGKTD